MALLKNKLINPPIAINLYFFSNNNIYQNPENFKKFRLKLLKNLCLFNNINYNNIKLIHEDNPWKSPGDVNQHQKEFLKLNDWRLKYNFVEPEIKEEYIIFHTKCRFYKGFDYKKLKEKLSIFYSNFKSDKKIVLLGERQITPYKGEEIMGITTIYDELLNLKNNNDLLDLTKEDIYSDLNYEDFVKDISLINKASKNVHVGCGGQFVFSLCFSNNVITYVDKKLKSLLNSNLINLDLNYKLETYFLNLN